MGFVGRQRLRETLKVDRLDNSTLREATAAGPYGPRYEEVVTNDECQETVLVKTAFEGQGARPGTRIPVQRIDGLGAGQALVSSPLGGSGALVPQESRSTIPAPPVSTQKSIALRVTSSDTDEIKVSVAAFVGSAFTELLFEDLVLPGGMNPLLTDPAIFYLRSARTIVGLAGVSDGSILLFTGNTFVQDPTPPPANDDTVHIHVIDIVTGVVHSREFTFSFPTFVTGFEARGWNIQDGKYYYMFENQSEARIELVTFSPTLTSQATLSTEIYDSGEGGLQFGTQFLADDAINSKNNSPGRWDRIPFSGTITDVYIDGAPTNPGNRAYGLGLRDAKYWVMGTDVAGLKPFFVPETTVISNDPPIIFEAIQVMGLPGWSGWTEMGPQFGEMFKQEGTPGFDIDGRAMYGFPVNRTAGTALGFLRLPLDALTWADAVVTIIDPNPFPPDMVLPDRR